MTIFALADVGDEVRGDEFARRVVAFRVLGLQHAQPVADGDAGRDDEKTPAEPAAARRAHRVGRVPGDQHRHDGGLAGPGRHLHRQAEEFRVGCGVAGFEMGADRAVLRSAGRDLEPDDRLDRLDLAKERADARKLMRAPVGEKPRRGRGDAPVRRIGQSAPARDVVADFVDDRSRIVFLLSRRTIVPVAESQGALGCAPRLHSRHGDGRDDLRPSPSFDRGDVERLPVVVQRMMKARRLVRAVQDWLFEKRGGHCRVPLTAIRPAATLGDFAAQRPPFEKTNILLPSRRTCTISVLPLPSVKETAQCPVPSRPAPTCPTQHDCPTSP